MSSKAVPTQPLRTCSLSNATLGQAWMLGRAELLVSASQASLVQLQCTLLHAEATDVWACEKVKLTHAVVWQADPC